MLMNLQALSREIHAEPGQEKKFQPSPLPTDMPIRIDMTIGDPSSRIVKVKHQGVEETVRILNNVLRKMNSDMKLELTKNGQPVEIPEVSNYSDVIMEEPVAGTERT
jgi:hypothetical protein